MKHFVPLAVLSALNFSLSVPARSEPRAKSSRSEAIANAPNLRLTIGSCNQDAKSWPPISDKTSNMVTGWEGVRSVSRRADGILQITATVVDNCASRPVSGGFSLQGESINLTYERAGPLNVEQGGRTVEVLAACNCLYQLTYEISNVPSGNFRASIRGTGLPGPGLDPRSGPASGNSDPDALYAQAQALENSENIHEAIRQYRRAARAGSGKAAKRLGEIYNQGIKDVRPDRAESLFWYERARENGEQIPLQR